MDLPKQFHPVSPAVASRPDRSADDRRDVARVARAPHQQGEHEPLVGALPDVVHAVGGRDPHVGDVPEPERRAGAGQEQGEEHPQAGNARHRQGHGDHDGEPEAQPRLADVRPGGPEDRLPHRAAVVRPGVRGRIRRGRRRAHGTSTTIHLGCCHVGVLLRNTKTGEGRRFADLLSENERISLLISAPP